MSNETYEQQKLDLDGITALEQEVNVIVGREYIRTKDDYEERYISPIKNKHEGYGHVADCLVTLETSVKLAKNDIKDFLSILPHDEMIKSLERNLSKSASKGDLDNVEHYKTELEEAWKIIKRKAEKNKQLSFL